MPFSASSPSFPDGARVPQEFTCDGSGAAPEIVVSGAPTGTKSFALIMDDPDAPGGTFTHWLAYDIPAGDGVLRTADAKTLANDFGRKGYGGPCPPRGHGVHRYYFTVYALDVPHLDVAGDRRSDLEAALARHTLAKAGFMGRYERTR